MKHWHGATPSSAMTHIAIQEELNGKAVEWMEKVTDEQYRRSDHSPHSELQEVKMKRMAAMIGVDPI